MGGKKLRYETAGWSSGGNVIVCNTSKRSDIGYIKHSMFRKIILMKSNTIIIHIKPVLHQKYIIQIALLLMDSLLNDFNKFFFSCKRVIILVLNESVCGSIVYDRVAYVRTHTSVHVSV